MANGVTFQFDDDGASKLLEDISKNLNKALDRDPNFVRTHISPIIYKDIIDHFNNESGPEGPWPEWSVGYAIKQQKKGRTRKLQDTGHLRNNFKPTDFRRDPEGVVWYNNAKNKEGLPYAEAHNEGIGYPKREFMWLSDSALEQVTEVTIGFLLKDS